MFFPEDFFPSNRDDNIKIKVVLKSDILPEAFQITQDTSH